MTLLFGSVPAGVNANTSVNPRTVSRNEVHECQLDDKTAYQLHEIRTERKHTIVMLQNIKGVNTQSINVARRRLQNRLGRIEQAEQFVLSTSCNQTTH